MIQSWLLLVPRWHWKVVGQKSQSCSCAVDLQWCVKCSWQWSNKHNFIQLMNSYSKLNTENGIELFWIETIEKEQQHFANAFVSHAIGKGKAQQCNGFPFLEDQSTKKIPKRIKPSNDIFVFLEIGVWQCWHVVNVRLSAGADCWVLDCSLTLTVSPFTTSKPPY